MEKKINGIEAQPGYNTEPPTGMGTGKTHRKKKFHPNHSSLGWKKQKKGNKPRESKGDKSLRVKLGEFLGETPTNTALKESTTEERDPFHLFESTGAQIDRVIATSPGGFGGLSNLNLSTYSKKKKRSKRRSQSLSSRRSRGTKVLGGELAKEDTAKGTTLRNERIRKDEEKKRGGGRDDRVGCEKALIKGPKIESEQKGKLPRKPSRGWQGKNPSSKQKGGVLGFGVGNAEGGTGRSQNNTVRD